MAINQHRLRLYGKPATKEEIAKEVSRLFLAGKGATEIRRDLDFNSTKTVYNYRDLACELKFLELGQDGKPMLPKQKDEGDFIQFTKDHPFANEPIIASWIKNLQFRKNGKPLKSWKQYVRNVEIVCNTLKINPSALLRGLDVSEQYLENFLMLYKEGKAVMSNKWSNSDMTNVAYMFSKGIRDLMNLHGLRYPKGKTGIMSQKVPNHAKYGDIRLTKDEIEQAKKYMIGKYGLDSDEVRLIFIAIESCSRAKALFNMSLNYDLHVSKKTGKKTYIMTAYETKTEHIKGGRWYKYITWEETQKSIDLLKSRGGSKLYESTETIGIFEARIKAASQDLFVHLGKIPNIDELDTKRANKVLNTGNYYYDHPLHVFRHIGAHYWLDKKGYNYGLVASLGGWNVIDELKNSYGEMPPSVVLELLEDEI